MQIKNPTKENITGVIIKGIKYEIEAEGTLENVPEEHARYWQSLHSFLILKKDAVVESPKIVLEPKVKEVEVVEEPTEGKAIVNESVEAEVVEVAEVKGLVNEPVAEEKVKEVKAPSVAKSSVKSK